MPADIRSCPVQRVALVVLDGLRPDAIARFRLQLGLARPESCVGRPLLQAFAKLPMAA